MARKNETLKNKGSLKNKKTEKINAANEVIKTANEVIKNNLLNDKSNETSLASYVELRNYAEKCLKEFRVQTKNIVNEETERIIRCWLELIANCISQQSHELKTQHCINQQKKTGRK